MVGWLFPSACLSYPLSNSPVCAKLKIRHPQLLSLISLSVKTDYELGIRMKYEEAFSQGLGLRVHLSVTCLHVYIDWMFV